MKDILVICRNCGEVERYAETYITTRNKNYHSCLMCGNRTQIYKENIKFVNEQIKKYNNQEVINLIQKDKYNSALFGRNKGFDYKKVEMI